MVASPAILLLDEFTAGLDAWNEKCVTNAIINRRPPGQTVIAVAQTLSTIRDADEIIFVGADGTIKEQGTWDELVALNGGFADFVKIQSLVKSDGGGGGGGADGEGNVSAILRQLSEEGDTDGDESEEAGATEGVATPVATGEGAGAKAPSAAARRWRMAKIKLTAAAAMMHSSDPHDAHSNVVNTASILRDAWAAVKTLKKIAKSGGLPADQCASLAEDCVRVNEMLRPANSVAGGGGGGSSSSVSISRADSYDGDAARLFARRREGSADDGGAISSM